jgi:hypothetical protein
MSKIIRGFALNEHKVRFITGCTETVRNINVNEGLDV